MTWMNPKTSVFAVIVALGSVLFLIGCDSNSAIGDSDTSTLSLSIHVPISPIAGKSGSGFIQTDGVNTLDISSVGIVLREIELEGELAEDCGEGAHDGSNDGGNDHDGDNDNDGSDDCEEFEAGPILLEPILDGSVDHLIEIEIPVGTYDELELKVHKLSADEPESQEFLVAHPEFDGLSIRVIGTYNGEPFVFEQDLNEELELDLNPPLVISAESVDYNLTVNIDIGTWFIDEQGDLVNPESANVGGENEGLIEENIKDSIEAFEDHDKDGDDDDDHDED